MSSTLTLWGRSPTLIWRACPRQHQHRGRLPRIARSRWGDHAFGRRHGIEMMLLQLRVKGERFRDRVEQIGLLPPMGPRPGQPLEQILHLAVLGFEQVDRIHERRRLHGMCRMNGPRTARRGSSPAVAWGCCARSLQRSIAGFAHLDDRGADRRGHRTIDLAVIGTWAGSPSSASSEPVAYRIAPPSQRTANCLRYFCNRCSMTTPAGHCAPSSPRKTTRVPGQAVIMVILALRLTMAETPSYCASIFSNSWGETSESPNTAKAAIHQHAVRKLGTRTRP
jgi:hypothetical protein